MYRALLPILLLIASFTINSYSKASLFENNKEILYNISSTRAELNKCTYNSFKDYYYTTIYNTTSVRANSTINRIKVFNSLYRYNFKLIKECNTYIYYGDTLIATMLAGIIFLVNKVIRR